MKKFGITLILFFTLFINVTNCVFAENYKYRLYDTVTKKVYYASMMTVADTPQGYYLGLYSGGTACLIAPDISKNEGLVGGDAIGISEDNDKRLYKWRELNSGNYYSEMHSIMDERKKEGKHIFQGYVQ